ncbi:AAA family ATPase [Planctomycetota bacterium]
MIETPAALDPAEVEALAERFRTTWERLRAEIGKVIVGHGTVLEQTLAGLFAGGHILLEGVPGLGKTLLVRTVARALDLRFRRIQFTPDLMPADILGTSVVLDDAGGHKRFEFREGPVFGNLVLADEVNRATPKTQSALLEAMEEHSVTVFGTTRTLTEPFCVIATQNPIELEGTYPLPEAQIDRFLLKAHVAAPDRDELNQVLQRTTGNPAPTPEVVASAADVLSLRAFVRQVPCAKHVLDYVARLVLATSPATEGAPDIVKRYVRFGSSPRGAQAMVLAGKVLALMRGRAHVTFDDIRSVAHPALRHRILLSFEGEAERIETDCVVDAVLDACDE